MAASCTPASVPLAREYPNFVTHLECSYSGKAYPKQVVHELCTCCDKPKPLIVKYDLAGIRASLTKKELRERTEPGFWKYREFLPVESTRNVSSLGEVCTPLIKLRTYNPGGAAVLVKDEVRPPRSCACSSSACSERSDNDAQGRLPTGSFKARGLVRRRPFLPAPVTTGAEQPRAQALGVSMAKELGITNIAMPTNGNAGAALAAYCSRVGVKATVLCPDNTPTVNVEEIAMQGAATYRVNGARRWLRRRRSSSAAG